MIVERLTEHPLEFLSLNEGCRGTSESTNVEIPHCLKSHVTANYHDGTRFRQDVHCSIHILTHWLSYV